MNAKIWGVIDVSKIVWDKETTMTQICMKDTIVIGFPKDVQNKDIFLLEN